MLALYVALVAMVLLVLVLAGVVVRQLLAGRGGRAPGAWTPDVLALDPGVGRSAEDPGTRRALEVRAWLTEIEARLVGGGAGTDRDEADLRADVVAAHHALSHARGAWAALDRLPLHRRAAQARHVLGEADRLVADLLTAQGALVGLAVRRLDSALATGGERAAAAAEDWVGEVLAMESLAGLRRELDAVLENLDLTTRADRVLHPRLSRGREGNAAVRAEVAEREWASASDLLRRATAAKV